MTIDATTDTHDTTFLDDNRNASGTYVTSPHLEGTPHAHIVTIPTCLSSATYGLTLLASRQLRWTSTLPCTCIPTWIPDNLRKLLLNHIPTITRANVVRLLQAKDTCTIHIHEFQGHTALTAFKLFRALAILTVCRRLTKVKHKQQLPDGHKHRPAITTYASLGTCARLDQIGQ